MSYIIDFCIISFFYLFITTLFYFKQNKVSNVRSNYFGILLIIGLCSLLLDVAVAVIDKNEVIPSFIIYILNILFLLCVQLNGPIFLIYTLIIVGYYPKLNLLYKAIITIPFGIIIILLLISPFVSWSIFTILPGNIYNPATLHLWLYVTIILYILTSLVLSIIKFRHIQKKKILAIIAFIVVTFIAMLLQLTFPEYLLNSMGNALALTIMYHTIQAPDEQIDSLTRLLNHQSMDQIVDELFEQNQSFSLKIFVLRDFRIVNQEYGIRNGDDLMIEIVKYLQKEYPNKYVIRIDGDIYGIIDFSKDNYITFNDLEKVKQSLPEVWHINNNNISLDISTIGINSRDYNNSRELKNIVNYIIIKHEKNYDVPILLVDKKYRDEREYYIKAEKALAKAIEENSIEVYYQPIHTSDGSLVAFEALSRLIDKELGFISPDLFIKIAEMNGSIYKLGEIVLNKVCDFIKEYHVDNWHLHHIGVNLSFLQCTNPYIFESLTKLIDDKEIPKGIISFEITETATDASFEMVKTNMTKFIESGYGFMLDDFGSGFANYNYLLNLPFQCIKIDKEILWQAGKNDRDLLYFKTLIDAINSLRLTTICEGVETLEQAKLLGEMGVTMQQGYLYSKALPKEETNKYAKRYLNI